MSFDDHLIMKQKTNDKKIQLRVEIFIDAIWIDICIIYFWYLAEVLSFIIWVS
jgi:hypothetical protein